MNCLQTVRKPCTNHMNIVFANKMFSSVYAALEARYWQLYVDLCH